VVGRCLEDDCTEGECVKTVAALTITHTIIIIFTLIVAECAKEREDSKQFDAFGVKVKIRSCVSQ
jgi:hypothetical protein